jgi:hypothetical protein
VVGAGGGADVVVGGGAGGAATVVAGGFGFGFGPVAFVDTGEVGAACVLAADVVVVEVAGAE